MGEQFLGKEFSDPVINESDYLPKDLVASLKSHPTFRRLNEIILSDGRSPIDNQLDHNISRHINDPKTA